jgi:hypothetical protein
MEKNIKANFLEANLLINDNFLKKQSSGHTDKNKNNLYSSNMGTYRKTMI